MSHLLHQYVSTWAKTHPDDVAVVLGPERMSYGELDDVSDRLARWLRDSGCANGDRVCLLVTKTPGGVASIIAVLKAGCAYVPVDITSPATRVEKIVRAADPIGLIFDRSTVGLVSDLMARHALDDSAFLVSIDGVGPDAGSLRVAGPDDWAGHPASPPPSTVTPDDPAYIMFTSGSTGEPKGVVITHSSVARFVGWAVPYFGIDRSDRNSGHSPLHFDLSVFDLFGTFAAGAQVHLIPAQANLVPTALVRLIRDAELTQWFSVPSTLAYVAQHGGDLSGLSCLRRVIWCGEVLQTPTLIHWMDALLGAQFTNLYGPTETTIASSYYTVPARPSDESASIPIGTPCDGEELLILDEAMLPVPAGEVGELYISGAGLSPGYWRDDDKTRAALLPHPFSSDPSDRVYRTGDLARLGSDGLFYFLGRTDSQVKSRGYRIELGEIEAALASLDLLGECAVVGASSTGFEGTTICCAFAPAPGRPIEIKEVRSALAKLLPTYMLPSRWKPFDMLPRNANGKVDRREIRDLFESEVA